MAELSTVDVELYTKGRLDRDDSETARALDAGLAAVRRWCRWHVTPDVTVTDLKVTGRGGPTLTLPTLNIITLTAVTEDGVELDVDDLDVDAGMVEKTSGAWWSTRLGGITVTMTHGFTAAPDFDSAVLSFIDRQSLAPTGGRPTVVGPFQYPVEALADGSAFTIAERALLEQYRLESPA